MNGGPGGMALPDQVVAQQIMQQNQEIAAMQNRSGAVQIAASISTPGTSIASVLEKAHYIEHYVKTGKIAKGAGAVDLVDD